MDKLEGNFLTVHGRATRRIYNGHRDVTGTFSSEIIECNKCCSTSPHKEIYETTHGVTITCPKSNCDAVDFFKKDCINLDFSS